MSEKKTYFFWVLALVFGLCVIYLPGLYNELVFDDQILTLGHVFDRYGGLFELKQRLISYGSFVWLETLFGDGWWKQRLLNLVLHGAVTVALLILFRMLSERVSWPEAIRNQPDFQSSRLAAVQVGVLFFAFNPVAVYAVAYLIQRSILGATLFVVLACIAFVHGVVSERRIWFVAAFALYVVALLCKEHALMAPALAVPLYIFLKRPGLRQIGLILAACLMLVFGAVVFFLSVYGEIIGVPFDELSVLYLDELKAIDPGIVDRAWPLSILNQAALFLYYGFLWFVPNVLWMAIDIRTPFPTSWSSWPHLAGAAAFVGVFVGASWLVLKRSDALGFLGLCLLFPLVLFATEFSTVWIQDPFVLYRSYMWAIAIPGIIMLLLVGTRPSTIYIIGFIVCLGLGGLAFERVISFRDMLSVWSDSVKNVDVDAGPNVVGRWRPYLNRGSYYLDNGFPRLAYLDFVRANSLGGDRQGSLQYITGVSLHLMQNHEEAIDLFERAESLGFTAPALYYQLGEAFYALGRHEEAFNSYSMALERNDDEAIQRQTRLRRAEAAIPARRYDVAIMDFRALLEGSPNERRLLIGLGMAYVGKKDHVAALLLFDRAIADSPDATAFYGRAMAKHIGGDRQASLDDIDEAIRLDPGNALYQTLRKQIADLSVSQ